MCHFALFLDEKLNFLDNIDGKIKKVTKKPIFYESWALCYPTLLC